MRMIFFLIQSSFVLGFAEAKPPIIDDSQIIKNFQEKVGILLEERAEGEVATVQELQKALSEPAGLPEISKVEAPSSALDSVFVVGSVYDCGKCDQWHPAGLATAWVLASDGVLCTNYHVIESFKGEAMAVSSWQGEVYLVTEILMADRGNDVAVFRVEAENLTPLPLGEEAAAIGEKISCLSHPNRRFFLHTFGEVARYHYKRGRGPKVAQMSITADYAKGSSGGPILNQKNEVVGMVASTSTIYGGKAESTQQAQFQMVVKNSIPGFVIRDLIKEEHLKSVAGETAQSQ